MTPKSFAEPGLSEELRNPRHPQAQTQAGAMSGENPPPPVERLFPLVLRLRLLLVGRETIRRAMSQLHFVLITSDLSDNSREEILKTFRHYPVVRHYTAADLEKYFALKGTKVIGFKKSALAQSIYAGLKPHRINKPFVKAAPQAGDLK
jgi:hypothetical protein